MSLVQHHKMAVFFALIFLLVAIGAILLYFARRNYLATTVNETIKEPVVLKIAVPINGTHKALTAEQLYQSLHGIIRGDAKSKDQYSFEIVANFTGIYFIAVCNPRYKTFLENQIYAQYPDAQIVQIKDYAQMKYEKTQTQFSELGFAREFYLPIRTFNSFDVDPLASITGAISKLHQHQEVWLQIVARPIDNTWQDTGKKVVDSRKNLTDEEGKKVGFESGESAVLSEVERKNTKPGFQFCIRILARGIDELTIGHALEDVEASFKQFQTVQFNSIVPRKFKTTWKDSVRQFFLGKRLGEQLSDLQKYQLRYLDEKEKQILNVEELASIYHLPSSSVKTANIAWVRSRKLEPPIDIPTSHARIIGVTDYRGMHVPFGIKREDRRRHMYLLGKTGTGKSLFIKNMVLGDIHESEGFCVVDPHGELVEEILNMIPERRLKDVIYLDPSDMDFPIGLNMLDIKEGESIELLADGIVSVFIKLFGTSWGPRLQYILTNTIQTLLQCQNVSLLAVQRILIDKNYRTFLLKQIKDPFILKFWNEEYEQMEKNPKLITEAISPIQNKVGRFLSSPLVRNMIGQVTSSINIRDVMDTGKILLINLSQGKIGEENTSLLGGLLITRIYTNAMQRANMDATQRKDFYLYVDEFQNFATDTFVKILSEARKYGLNLLVTHQFIDQIAPNIQDAVFGNVGTMINYVVGPKDAGRLEKEFKPFMTAEDLVNLEKFAFSAKLTIDGAQSNPFTGRLIIPQYPNYGLKQQIIHHSREVYASKREEVEFKLNKWAGQVYNSEGNLVQSTK